MGESIIDAVFRGGDKQSNNGDTVEKMIHHVVHMIRTRYSEIVPFVIRMDDVFYDTMLLGFFLFESFKEDVNSPVVTVKFFPTTLRRRLVDVAAKVVSHVCVLGVLRSRTVLR